MYLKDHSAREVLINGFLTSFCLDPRTFSIPQEAVTFWEVRFLFRLTIPLADCFIVTENGRDCDWLIFLYDQYVKLQKCWCLGRFKREASFTNADSSFSELELPFPPVWEGSCGELLHSQCLKSHHWLWHFSLKQWHSIWLFDMWKSEAKGEGPAFLSTSSLFTGSPLSHLLARPKAVHGQALIT